MPWPDHDEGRVFFRKLADIAICRNGRRRAVFNRAELFAILHHGMELSFTDAKLRVQWLIHNEYFSELGFSEEGSRCLRMTRKAMDLANEVMQPDLWQPIQPAALTET